MSKREKRLQKCESTRDFRQHMDTSPDVVSTHESGDHKVYKNSDGDTITLTNHRWALPPYTRERIIKTIIALGFTALPLIFLASAFKVI